MTFGTDPNPPLLAVASGLFVVPLYAFIQQRSGSQEKGRVVAVNNFRVSRGFHFTFTDGDGELRRPRQGMEELRVHVARGADRGEWLASVKPTGVVWTKDGGHVADVPQSMQRLFQRLTIFPDPQKKEGAAQRAGDHFEFTDANSGERYVVTVKGAEIVEFRIGNERVGITPR